MALPQNLYYFPQWMNGSPLLSTVREEEEDSQFAEISTKSENFITCNECGRPFHSKKSYNTHIPVCVDGFYIFGGHPISTSEKSDSKKKCNNVLRARSKSMPTPNGTTDMNQVLGIKQEPVQNDSQKVNGVLLNGGSDVTAVVHVNGKGQPVKIKLENGRSTSIDEYLMQESNSLGSSDSYECRVCHKVYFTKYGFKLHLRTHTGNKGYTCDICGKSFSQSGHLKDHRRIHTGEKPFTCELCGKKFAQNQNLKHHLRMHSGVRPYKCKNCEKAFFTKCELSSHERVHSGDKPYTCQVCAKSFSQLSGLKAHLKNHEDNGPLACPCCDQIFENQATLLNHIRCHESGGPYSCKICGASFMKKGSLHHHTKFHQAELKAKAELYAARNAVYN